MSDDNLQGILLLLFLLHIVVSELFSKRPLCWGRWGGAPAAKWEATPLPGV